MPDATESGIVALHLKRYVFAEKWARGKRVLDAACGVGYGTAELARVAREVIGVDVSEEAIAYARQRYAGPNITFELGDVTQLPHPDGSFDLVCSFETLEHVHDAPAAIQEAARVLRTDGVYVASTPSVARTTATPVNPFHTTEYAPDDFASLLRASFGEVELYGQHRRETTRHRLLRRLDVLGLRRHMRLPGAAAVVGSPATANISIEDVTLERGALRGASEVVAVCLLPR